MRVLFLIITFTSLIFTVEAQRIFNQYTCQLSHKHSEVAFYLNVFEMKEVEVGGWKLLASITRRNQEMDVVLKRVVTVMDATYQKEARRTYPREARALSVKLEHPFGGKTDVFDMVCYPRDP